MTDTKDLVDKYRELVDILDNLRKLELDKLVDQLMSPGNDACSIIREAALLDLDKMKTIEDLRDCIRSNATQPTAPEKADYVRVMSLHKSKGLTSKIVIVSACTRGLVPFEDSDETPEEAATTLKEQRRLFYVAITRCTETLVISSAANMRRDIAWKLGARVVYGRGPIGRTIASPFIDELGPGAPHSKRGTYWSEKGYRE